MSGHLGPLGTGPDGPSARSDIEERERVLTELEPILPLVERHAAWAEEQRRPHPEVFAALAAAGLLRLIAPVPYGGRDLGPPGFLAFIEALGRVDGSTAWAAMTINEEVGIACSYLPAATMTEVLTTHPEIIIAGSGVALGKARVAEGGWTINGRWGFISGGPVADRLILASRVVDEQGRTERLSVDGVRQARRVCFALIPADQAQLDDTWHTAGLRGTGSHDMVVENLFVPDHLTGVFSLEDEPVPTSPYYCLPSGLRFNWPKVGVAVGIARAAIDAFEALATSKRPSHLPELLADRANAQAAMAQAEALVSAGWAWVNELQVQVWAEAVDPGPPIEPGLHARSRLAAAYAVDSAVRAVEGLASAAGTTAGKLDGPWPRMLADVRAVAQHFMVGPQQMQTAGRVLLGREPGDPVF